MLKTRFVGVVLAVLSFGAANPSDAQIKRLRGDMLETVKRQVALYEKNVAPTLAIGRSKCDDPEGIWDVRDAFATQQEADAWFGEATKTWLISKDKAAELWNLNDALLSEYQQAVRYFDAACQERGSAGRLPECFARWIGRKPGQKLTEVETEHELSQRFVLGRLAALLDSRLLYDLYPIVHMLVQNDPGNLADDAAVLALIESREQAAAAFVRDYGFTTASPLYGAYVGKVADAYRRCTMRARQYQLNTSIEALDRWSKGQTRSATISAALAPFRIGEAGFREGLALDARTLLQRVEERMRQLRANEEAARHAEFLRQQQEAQRRAQELAARERAEQQRLQAELAARKASLIRLAASADGAPAPTDGELLQMYIESALRHSRYGPGPRANEIAERGAGGAQFYQTLSVNGARCTIVERNTYKCTYTIAMTRRVSNDGSLAAFGGQLFMAFGLDALTNYTSPSPTTRTDSVIFHKGGWWSSTLDQSIDRAVRIEAAAEARSASATMQRSQREPMWDIDWTDPANPVATPNLAYRP